MKTQTFGKGEDKPKKMQVFDNREAKPGQELRTILYVEAGDMPIDKFSELVRQVSASYANSDKGAHYVLPVRFGKIGADIFFEHEWLSVVNQTCEVDQDGKIVLKNGAKDVLVRREYIQ